jgi:hypothetical protein
MLGTQNEMLEGALKKKWEEEEKDLLKLLKVKYPHIDFEKGEEPLVYEPLVEKYKKLMNRHLRPKMVN